MANSNATVIISQQGRTIYQTQVAAGPFRIQDLNDALSGELDVRVEEQNGKTQTFTVNTSVFPTLLDQGKFVIKLLQGDLVIPIIELMVIISLAASIRGELIMVGLYMVARLLHKNISQQRWELVAISCNLELFHLMRQEHMQKLKKSLQITKRVITETLID